MRVTTERRIGTLALLVTAVLTAPALGCGRGYVWRDWGGHYSCMPIASPILYRWDTKQSTYIAVAADATEPGRLYYTWSPQLGRWAWVTADDLRPLAPGSKVQWKRIESLGDKAELDWYRLEDNGLRWMQVTDHERPAILRFDPDGKVVMSEQYPENWQTLGGTLDPDPPRKPSCSITPTPRSGVVHQPRVLHVDLAGTVTDVVISGQHLPIHLERSPAFAETTILPASPGFYTAAATVTGPAGTFTCDAPYDVQPPPLTCHLAVDNPRARAGESVLVTLTSEGKTVDRAEIDGVLLEGIRSAPGQGVKAEWRVRVGMTGKAKVKGKVTGGDASAECEVEIGG